MKGNKFLERVKQTILEGKFSPEIQEAIRCCPDSDIFTHEFVGVLAGGNLEFPEEVIKLAREKLLQEFPELEKELKDGNNGGKIGC